MAILHRTRNLSAIMPRYVERFRCVGPSCEDTCCNGWSVHVDKKTFKAYRASSDPVLRPVGALLRRIDNPPNAGMYGVLPASAETGSCPAHKDGMCTIHASAGESYLSDTCQSYPRINRLVNNQFEHSMTLSCPEAARLALLAEDAFDLIEGTIGIRDGTMFGMPLRAGFTSEMLNEARVFCLNLMRTREVVLWQRLALLGAFSAALDECADGGEDGVRGLIGDFVRAIEGGELTAILDHVQPGHEAQAMVFAMLWASKGFDEASPFHVQHMAAIAAGLGGDDSGQVSGTALVRAYRRGLQRLEQALTAAPWLLENYVLNEMFSHQFPMTGTSAYDSYLQLVARFGLLRLLLAAQCNTEDTLPPLSTLVATVQLQCRRFQHNPLFAAQINDSLRTSGWGDLKKVNTLLRT